MYGETAGTTLLLDNPYGVPVNIPYLYTSMSVVAGVR